MGWRFRRSIGFGNGFRINISKSGIGYSWGIKGFRITRTATGRIRKTFTIPGTGISYVDERGLKRGNYQRVDSTSSITDLNNVEVENFRPAEHEDIIKRITAILNWNVFFKGLMWFAVLSFAIPKVLVIPAIGVIGKLLLSTVCNVNLDYHFDSENERRYNDCLQEWLRLNGCCGLWQIVGQRYNSNTKAHSGAKRTVSRKNVKIRKHKPFYIDSNLDIITLKLKKETMVFLPDKIIIVEGRKVGAISYADIEISVEETNFIETKIVPKDAIIIRHTWKYSNKDGSRDKRYSNNYRLPVCKYGVIKITSLQGLNIELQCSNCSIAYAFGEYAKII